MRQDIEVGEFTLDAKQEFWLFRSNEIPVRIIDNITKQTIPSVLLIAESFSKSDDKSYIDLQFNSSGSSSIPSSLAGKDLTFISWAYEPETVINWGEKSYW